MNTIKSVYDLLVHVKTNRRLPVQIDIACGEVRLKGIATTIESLMGALKKISIIMDEKENLDLDEVKRVLISWEGSGGGFSGGGASGGW
ncbi:hypothetical protein [Citrobacter sp. RHBSTW-00671]|uniref:hypothetical protein n=1 Tax=Citrobacter sp. RHBSTW-00671 TaxID=2742660 RepID=UPI0017E74DDD|nr:hypothetical protein [Citrobacter sp. RHBSTW-00671]MBA7967876.1 hypothetical protein [Citrobacter sp. RHBSTW-00671]HCJ6374178.1 hypothetical protein [Citrobacter freundii]